MTRYSKEFKDNIIKQMMPPANKSKVTVPVKPPKN